jgi:outer membrane protein assembly factor BamB
MKRIFLSLLFFCTLFFSCTTIKIKDRLKIDESYDWLMSDGNPSRTNIYGSSGFANPPYKLIWSFDNDASYPVKNFAAADAVLFSGNLKGEIYGIDITSGKSLGSFSTSSPSQINGFVIYDNNIIITRTGDDNKSTISYNIHTGKENWSADLGWTASSPVISGENLIVSSMDGYIINLDPKDGKTKWKYKDEDEYRSNQFSASPTIYKGNIYTGNVNGYLYILNLISGEFVSKFKTDAPIYSDVSAATSGIFFFSDDMNFYCLDTSGSLKWKKNLYTKSYSSSAFYKDCVITSAVDGCVYALNISNGDVVWKYQTYGSIWASPLLCSGKIFIGSFDKNFYCLNADSGELLWKYKLEGRIRSNAVIWKEFIFVCSDDKNIYCFK